MRAPLESGSRGEATRLPGCSAIKALLSANTVVAMPCPGCPVPRPGLVVLRSAKPREDLEGKTRQKFAERGETAAELSQSQAVAG